MRPLPRARSGYCASYQLRKQALYNDMRRYTCCNGMFPCSGSMGEQKSPECCLCMEVHNWMNTCGLPLLPLLLGTPRERPCALAGHAMLSQLCGRHQMDDPR